MRRQIVYLPAAECGDKRCGALRTLSKTTKACDDHPASVCLRTWSSKDFHFNMCYQVIELYSACRCPYYQHAVDRCESFSKPGHSVQRRTLLVGYACSAHTASIYDSSPPSPQTSDQGEVSEVSEASETALNQIHFITRYCDRANELA